MRNATFICKVHVVLLVLVVSLHLLGNLGLLFFTNLLDCASHGREMAKVEAGEGKRIAKDAQEADLVDLADSYARVALVARYGGHHRENVLCRTEKVRNRKHEHDHF